MADSTSTTLTEISPQTGPSSFGSGFDAEGLPTVHEIPHHKANNDSYNPADQRSMSIDRLSISRDASINSSIGRSYNEKDMAAEAPQVPYTTSPRGARQIPLKTDAPSAKLRKGDRRNTVATQYAEPTFQQRPRRGGLRNTIRRIFGRRSMKDRISMPTGPVYRRHVGGSAPCHRRYANTGFSAESGRIHYICYGCPSEGHGERTFHLNANKRVPSF